MKSAAWIGLAVRFPIRISSTGKRSKRCSSASVFTTGIILPSQVAEALRPPMMMSRARPDFPAHSGSEPTEFVPASGFHPAGKMARANKRTHFGELTSGADPTHPVTPAKSAENSWFGSISLAKSPTLLRTLRKMRVVSAFKKLRKRAVLRSFEPCQNLLEVILDRRLAHVGVKVWYDNPGMRVTPRLNFGPGGGDRKKWAWRTGSLRRKAQLRRLTTSGDTNVKSWTCKSSGGTTGCLWDYPIYDEIDVISWRGNVAALRRAGSSRHYRLASE